MRDQSMIERRIPVRLLFAVLLLCGHAAHGDAAHGDDWSQWRGKDRQGRWTETGVMTSFTEADLKPIWRQPVGTGYSSPTVADGKVFLMDFDEPAQTEAIRCFDARTGQPLWQKKYRSPYTISYTAGPRAAVTVDEGLAFALGAMGRLHCLNVNDGTVAWELDLDAKYNISADRRMPIWGIACSPIIHGDLVIVQIGAKAACVVAFNKKTGDEAWRSLDDRGQYSSPVLVKQNQQDVLVCWTGDSVSGLNPLDGTVHWSVPFKPTNMPIGVATPIVRDNKIFLTSFYDGSMMIELGQETMTAKQLWHEIGPNERVTKALHSIISTPVWIKDHIYGVDSYGELRCIDPADGSRVWEDLTAVNKNRWGTIHFVPNGDQVWMFNEQGDLMLGRLSPAGLELISRANVLQPNQMRTPNRRGGVCWSHPAFANRSVFVRNDSELICIDLTAANSADTGIGGEQTNKDQIQPSELPRRAGK